ncbi:MAG: hypothetical protein S4CHLAM81_09140 [Chlamydiales bacterium]|nr:hypothetical protein [Chlamydiales bacterium]MCH9635693.1 hypothetical protein [Chlamydiales bacterium]
MDIVALLFGIFFALILTMHLQKKRRVRLVIRGYEERIEKLEQRLKAAKGEAHLSASNQLRFLQRGLQEYVCEKKKLL